MLKKSISDNVIASIYEEMWGEAVKEYGTEFAVPRDVSQAISDYSRALHVLQIWKKDGAKGSPVRFMASYSIPENILADVAGEFCGIEVDEDSVVEEVRPTRRADKWDSFLKWAKDKVFQQFTTEELVEISGFSYQTTLKFVSENPTFRKVKRGLWEIRDAKADREAEKS